MRLINKIFYIGLIIIFIFFIVWGINITLKQMEFSDNCKNACGTRVMEYTTTFMSSPWNNVNGKCYCVNKTNFCSEQIKLQEG